MPAPPRIIVATESLPHRLKAGCAEHPWPRQRRHRLLWSDRRDTGLGRTVERLHVVSPAAARDRGFCGKSGCLHLSHLPNEQACWSKRGESSQCKTRLGDPTHPIATLLNELGVGRSYAVAWASDINFRPAPAKVSGKACPIAVGNSPAACSRLRRQNTRTAYSYFSQCERQASWRSVHPTAHGAARSLTFPREILAWSCYESLLTSLGPLLPFEWHLLIQLRVTKPHLGHPIQKETMTLVSRQSAGPKEGPHLHHQNQPGPDPLPWTV